MKPTSFYKTCLVLLLSALLMYSCNSSSTRYAVDDTNHLWRGWNYYQIPESDSMDLFHSLVLKEFFPGVDTNSQAQFLLSLQFENEKKEKVSEIRKKD